MAGQFSFFLLIVVISLRPVIVKLVSATRDKCIPLLCSSLSHLALPVASLSHALPFFAVLEEFFLAGHVWWTKHWAELTKWGKRFVTEPRYGATSRIPFQHDRWHRFTLLVWIHLRSSHCTHGRRCSVLRARDNLQRNSMRCRLNVKAHFFFLLSFICPRSLISPCRHLHSHSL